MISLGLPFAAYQALPAVNFSTLKHMATSPLHYRHACDHARAATDAMRLGSLTHALALHPPGSDLPAGLAVYPGPVRRGKAWEAFERERSADLIVTEGDIITALAIRAAVWAHPEAARLLEGADYEVTMRWDEGGVAAKGRLDAYRDDGIPGSAGPYAAPTIVELKTTRAIAPDAFAREAARRLYHAQAGWYARGIEASAGAWPVVAMVAVENVPPHDVAVYRVPDDALVAGLALVRGWVERVRECRASGRWPGVCPEARELRLPDWATVGPELSTEDLEVMG